MSDTMTPAPGSGTVQEAASQIFDLIDTDETPEGQDEAVETVEEEVEEAVEATEEPEEVSEEEDTEPEPTYHLKMAGEEREVTQSELIKLAQQGADYTKKSQQVSEQRKALDAETKVIEEARQRSKEYSEGLSAVQKYLSDQQRTDVDLDYLRENDPIGYNTAVADMMRREKQMTAINNEQLRIAKQQEAETAEHNRRYISSEAQKLAELIPDYAEPQKGEALRRELRDYAKSIGYTDAEVGTVYDSRIVKALYDAAQYQKLVSSKPAVNKKVQSAPKMVKAGTSPSKTSNTEAQRKQFQQLKATGRVRDAAALLENLI